MKKYKCKLKYDFVTALERLIDAEIEVRSNVEGGDEHNMYIAALAEIKMKIAGKLIDVKLKYAFSFSPVQAFAIRMLRYNLLQHQPQIRISDYMANRLLQITSEIHQYYS